MLKKNLKTIVVTSFVAILPMFAGFLMWDKLPEKLPTHWNFEGEIDGWSSKPFAVIFIPLLMLVFHLICTVVTSCDPKTQNFNRKVFGLVLWICPVLSLLCMTATYAAALGFDVKVEFIIPLFMGVLFLVIGNYLPKCKQNYTIGIKIPWTLKDEENWNKTHRFAGIVWTVCAIAVIIGAFFSRSVVYTTFIPIIIMVFAPMIYSYSFHRNHKDNKR